MTGLLKPKIIVGCEFVNELNDTIDQHCTNCKVRAQYSDDRVFAQKCESMRCVLGAKPIYDTNGVRRISVESKEFQKQMKEIEFDGDIYSFAKKLHELLEPEITEAEAVKLEKSGAVRSCDIRGRGK